MKKFFTNFTRELIQENPIFVLALGLCPALAISTSVNNAIGMGVATTFVLLGSNTIVSLIRKVVPQQIRIPCFIVIIATFVTMVELLMKAFSPALSEALGIYVPLIAVNCVVLGRAEAFASKNGVLSSIRDGLNKGIGFRVCSHLLI